MWNQAEARWSLPAFDAGIGRARVVGRGLGEQALRAQRAVHLVGGDVQEAEARLGLPLERAPVLQRRLQHDQRAHHVGAHELARPGDRAVHVALGGQVQHGVGPVLGEGRVHRGRIGDVGLHEAVAGRRRRFGHGARIGGVGELVEVHHLVPLRGVEPADGGADEARPARDQNLQDRLRAPSHPAMDRVRAAVYPGPAADGTARAEPSVPTILVTGGAGYVGAHCCKAFARAGWTVVVFDSPGQRLARLRALRAVGARRHPRPRGSRGRPWPSTGPTWWPTSQP